MSFHKRFTGVVKKIPNTEDGYIFVGENSDSQFIWRFKFFGEDTPLDNKSLQRKQDFPLKRFIYRKDFASNLPTQHYIFNKTKNLDS